MNLAKALKRKKKLVSAVNKNFHKFSAYNSVEVGSDVFYEARECYEAWIEAVNDLVELKAKIFIANQPIYSKILELGELKSIIEKLKSVSTLSGKVSEGGRYGSPETTKDYVCKLGIVEIEEIVERYEEGIDNLQSEIEEFNRKTKI